MLFNLLVPISIYKLFIDFFSTYFSSFAYSSISGELNDGDILSGSRGNSIICIFLFNFNRKYLVISFKWLCSTRELSMGDLLEISPWRLPCHLQQVSRVEAVPQLRWSSACKWTLDTLPVSRDSFAIVVAEIPYRLSCETWNILLFGQAFEVGSGSSYKFKITFHTFLIFFATLFLSFLNWNTEIEEKLLHGDTWLF